MIERISAEQALSRIEEGVQVLDIRDEASFQANHIAGALHLDSHSLSDFLAAADRDKPYIVCCYHGHSSLNAAQFLLNQDFTEIASLDGGFEQWCRLYPQHCSQSSA